MIDIIDIPIATGKASFKESHVNVAGLISFGKALRPPLEDAEPIKFATVLTGIENMEAMRVEITIPIKDPGIFFVKIGEIRMIPALIAAIVKAAFSCGGANHSPATLNTFVYK